MRQRIVGVMGPGSNATNNDLQAAYELGQRIAQQNWILLTGGRDTGVMDAASRGAKQASGITIGILPGSTYEGISAAVDIPILTGIGSARNNINVLSSEVVFACGMGAGTASEVALALKANKPVILLNFDDRSSAFFQGLSDDHVFIAQTPEAAIAIAQNLLKINSSSPH
jgi:uncharacterized protein (TIGR00725 family)